MGFYFLSAPGDEELTVYGWNNNVSAPFTSKFINFVFYVEGSEEKSL